VHKYANYESTWEGLGKRKVMGEEKRRVRGGGGVVVGALDL